MPKLSKPNTVPVPDEFFDIALKECSPEEVVVLALVIKHTLKFGKTWDWMSRSQFQSEVNLLGKTIYNAIEGLTEKEWLLRIYECAKCKHKSHSYQTSCENCGQKGLLHPYYSLNIGDELVKHLRKTHAKITLPLGNHLAIRQPPCHKATQETSLQETSTNTTDQTTPAGDADNPPQSSKNVVEGQMTKKLGYSLAPKQESHPPFNNQLVDISTPQVSQHINVDHPLPPPETEFNVKFCSHPIYNFFLANTSQKLIEFIPDSDKAVLRELKERKVPENVIKEGIKLAIKAHKPRFSRDHIRTLTYCEPFIYQVFEKWKAGDVEIPLTEQDRTNKRDGFFKRLVASLDQTKLKEYIADGFITEDGKPTTKFIKEWDENDERIRMENLRPS